MKDIRWSAEKNAELQKTRGITFEQLISARFIGIEKHPKKIHQKLMFFQFHGYIWVVPYVETEDTYFLKTAFPNRKYTRKYLGDRNDKN